MPNKILDRVITGLKHFPTLIPRIVFTLWVFFVALGVAQAGAGGLTVKRVILSTGGVGYFELEAQINGDAKVSFSVPLNQVDDILKSLVIADSGGGTARVTTAGWRPLKQIFQAYPFRASDLTSPRRLLNRLRGAQVRISGATTMEGRILRVEKEIFRPAATGSGNNITAIRHQGTLLTADGLRQFIVEEVAGIDFLDTELKRQLEEATAYLAAHGRKDRREITIETKGEGARILQLGYVVAVPLWKSTYRLVLPFQKAGAKEAGTKANKARLQGWAVIENLSGLDWKDVELSVVSGNPVTFRQALYKPYFVKRPRVPLEIAGRVLPPPDDGALSYRGRRSTADTGSSRARRALRKTRAKAKRRARSKERATAMMAPPILMRRTENKAKSPSRLIQAAGIIASDSVTQVAFTFKGGQTIASGFTVMLPIIDRLIPAARISLYQARVHRSRPLAAVRLKNDGESGLPPGILTLFELGEKGRRNFIGDARIKAFPAGEIRLLSFAVDQRSRVAVNTKSQEEIVKISADGGLLRISLEQEVRTQYRIQSPKREGRHFIIEHGKRAGWTLKQPAKSDTATLRAYRFKLMLGPDQSKTLTVLLRRTRAQSIAITGLSSRQLVAYFKSGKIGQEAEAALRRIAKLRRIVGTARRQVQRLKSKRTAIAKEQNRIRANMRSIARTSKLFGRYVKKLNLQENQLERLMEGLQAAQSQLDLAQVELSKFVRALRF